MANDHRITVGEHTYICTKIPARAGLRAACRLANALSPIMNYDDKLSVREAIFRLASQPELGEHIETLCDFFAPHTQVLHDASGRSFTLSEVFDAHFAGNYSALIQWLTAAVEFNLSSFFAALPGLARKAEAGLVGSNSKSPST